MSNRSALLLAYEALSRAERQCRYHGSDFACSGWEWGEPRCGSCKQPWRVDRALRAIASEIDAEPVPSSLDGGDRDGG